jgi:hypothetical protein
MELTEEAVEEVALGRCMPVACCSAALVMGSGARGSGERGQRPHVAGGADAVVLDESAADELLFACCPVDAWTGAARDRSSAKRVGTLSAVLHI